MTKAAIARAFSNGEFDKTNDFIADDAVWEVVNEDKFNGKNAIIENCNRVGQYFKSFTTDFKTQSIISEDNKVVVNGTAEFIKDGKRVSFVSACDLYEFNDRNQVQKITSYCIHAK
jgi:ketosteroid isomerase-like protein